MSEARTLETRFHYKWSYPGKVYFVKNMEKIWILGYLILKDIIST